LLHVRPLGFTDFIASAGTAQWGQVTVIEAISSGAKHVKTTPGTSRIAVISSSVYGSGVSSAATPNQYATAGSGQ
ncbi:hypothetical protein VDS21_23195, partial [Xanthomonas campestris pv. campestris]|nr:hypothetical protein [Xanthomonas campestris pv. campestris]